MRSIIVVVINLCNQKYFLQASGAIRHLGHTDLRLLAITFIELRQEFVDAWE